MEQQKLNPTVVYILSILGFLCCCILGSGFILSGAGYFIAHSKLKDAKMNPENYDPQSVNSMNTARIISLVVLIINLLYLAYSIYQISTVGWDNIMDQYQEAMEQYQNQQAQ